MSDAGEPRGRKRKKVRGVRRLPAPALRAVPPRSSSPPPPPPRAPPPTFSRLPVALGRYRRDRLDPALSPPPPPHSLPLPPLSPPPSPPPIQGGDGSSKPGAQARRDIDAACARGDAAAAFAAFDAAVAERAPLQPHSCNVLLHLCAGGVATAGGYGALSEPPPRTHPVPSRAEVHPERANAVFNHMVAENVPRTEMTYTALARVEAAVGEPQRALALVARLREERLVPKLRTYAPALHAFCARDDVEGADRCASAISRDDAGLELGESEYAALMDLYARNIATEGSEGSSGGVNGASVVERGFGRLRELAETVRAVGEDLAGSIARFFDAAPGWATQAHVAVDVASGSGTAAPSGRTIQLRAVHLSAEDRARLLAGIGKLAREREVADAFGGFARWLRRRGPLPFLVDGANVGMFNQNFKESAFRFDQVERVVKRLRPEAKAIRKARLEAMKAEAKTKAGAKEEDERRDDADPEEEDKSGGGEGGGPEDPRGGGDPENPENPAAPPPITTTTPAASSPPPPSSDPASVQAAMHLASAESDAALLSDLHRSAGAGAPTTFLHVRRTRGGPANGAKAREALRAWRDAGELFVTPAGSNDDWYWLYAAVASGDDAYLVSNDEMRDHAFQMLPAPRLFRRWKERHQVRFKLGPRGEGEAGDGVELFFPSAYSHCVQEGGDEGWWMFPKEGGGWVCAVRE